MLRLELVSFAFPGIGRHVHEVLFLVSPTLTWNGAAPTGVRELGLGDTCLGRVILGRGMADV